MDVPAPVSVPPATPIVTGASYDAQTGELTLTGSDFGVAGMSGDEVRVAFRQGSDPVYVTGSDAISFSATQIKLRVPKQVVLGLSGIFVERAKSESFATTGGSTTVQDWTSSQRVTVNNPGGYGFVGQYRTLKILDLQTKQQGGIEQVVKEIDLGQYIVDTATTADLSRAFLAVEAGTDKPAGIWVVDGIGLQLADATPATDSLDLIALPNGVRPTAMELDPNGRYLYVAAGSAIYVIDIRPGEDLHRIVDTIAVTTPNNKINGIALNADGTRLWLTAPATELFGERNPGRSAGAIRAR